MSDDFEIYDVTLICRHCGDEFPGKSFIRRTYDNLGYGICSTCDAIANAPKLPNPDPPTRDIWEPD